MKIVCLSRLSIVVPRNEMRPRNVLCEQCSLQVWAKVSSSQSVGSRPSSAKCRWIDFISGRLKASCPDRLRCNSSASVAPDRYRVPWNRCGPGRGRSRSSASVPTTAISTAASLASTRWTSHQQRRGRAFDTVGSDRADIQTRDKPRSPRSSSRALAASGSRKLPGLEHTTCTTRARPIKRCTAQADRGATSTTGSTRTSKGNALQAASARFLPRSKTRAPSSRSKGRRARTQRPEPPTVHRVGQPGRTQVQFGCARAWGLKSSVTNRNSQAVRPRSSSFHINLTRKSGSIQDESRRGKWSRQSQTRPRRGCDGFEPGPTRREWRLRHLASRHT